MAKATPAQWNTAIANFRRHAANFQRQADACTPGSWQQKADLRLVAQMNAKADALEKMQAALAAPTLAVTATIN